MHSAQASAGGSKSESGYKKEGANKEEGKEKFIMPPPNPKAYVDMIEVMELVGNDPEKRNWKGIVIAVMVILVVFALITVSVVLVTPEKENGIVGDPMEFQDLYTEEFKPIKYDAHWVPDKEVFLYRSREGEIMEYNVNDNKSVIMDNSTFRQLNTDIYFVSEDLMFVLIAHNVEKLYRHSFLAEYKIYNRRAPNPSERLIKFPQDINSIWQGKKLQYAGWSTKGQALTFVYDNNLYYQSNPFQTPMMLTRSGSNMVLNGRPDWLYEEEIFHSSVSHWFNPQSSSICYTQINDTNVPVYTFPWYGDPNNVDSNFKTITYPKAGERGQITPKIKLFVAPLNSEATAMIGSTHKEIKPPKTFANKEHYVILVKWLNETTVLVVWSNRPQNHSIVTICDIKNDVCFINLKQKSTGGWIEIAQVFPIDNGKRYLTLLPELDFKRIHFKHIAVVTTPSETEGLKTFITQGSFDVTDIVGYDESEQMVYYISTNENPMQRHLFRVKIPSPTEKPHKGECLTCNYTENCTYISTQFSYNAKYYIMHCMGPKVPYTVLRNTHNQESEIMLEANTELKLHRQTIAEIEEELWETSSDDGHKYQPNGVSLLDGESNTSVVVSIRANSILIKMLLPPLLNKEHITLYPMLVHTYAAPGTQKVTDKFELGWETYLVTHHNVIYVTIDGRGSGARGERVLHSVYKRLGTSEVQDQITAVEFLISKCPYIDHERIAIWGWSYGGFVSAHVLGDRDNDVFSCGIAVAPVTDWRYYDTAYTERYMGLASESTNYKQYDKANVSSKAEHFKGKKFMLIHGTADDNVHYQHTAQFIKALTAADIDFRVQVYTDQNHALSGKSTNKHLYKTMTSFLRQSCWKGGNPRELRNGEYVDVNIAELSIR